MKAAILDMEKIPKEVIDRFWAKVKPPVGIGECWEWKAGKFAKGYGQFNNGQTMQGAHRFAYEQVFGQIPEEKVLDHLCRNPSCVNPYHLEVVTMRENTLRGVGITAQAARKTHCPKGHEYTPENLVQSLFRKTGYRMCLTCERIRPSRKRRATRSLEGGKR